MTKIRTTGLKTLVGQTVSVAQNDWTAAITETLRPEDSNGKVLGFNMSSRIADATGGTGTILLPSGTFAVFNADPGLTVGDAALASGVPATILGTIAVATGDWISQTLGAWVTKVKADIPFFTLKDLYFAFFYTLAGTINSATGDEEILELAIQYEIDEH